MVRIESDCTLRDGVNSLISNISYTKQSNLFLHFLSTKKLFVKVFRDNTVFVYKVPANGRRLVILLNRALVYVPKCIRYMYITSTAQVALKFLNYTLLVYNRRFVLLYSKHVLDLVADKNRLNDFVGLLD